MALVAYGNSDSSDYEDDDSENKTVAKLITKPEVPGPSTVHAPITTVEPNTEGGPNLFNLLPQPSTKKPAVVEEDDEFLHKKEKVEVVKPKARIMVPSLRDFKDVDSPAPVAKSKVINEKKSGLLSMLPQPKNGLTTSKFFTPYVLTKKNNDNAKTKAPRPPPEKKPKMKSKKSVNEYSDDSDNDEDVQNDFFSIHKPVEVPVADILTDTNLNFDQVPTSSKTERSKLESFFKKDPVEVPVEHESAMEGYEEYANSEAGSSYSNLNGDAEFAGNSQTELDEEAILKLCGARGMRKRENIQIVEVNQREVLADAREWLLKGLMDDTTSRVSASKKRGNEPTSQQKRKHQITYLAHQAKANEAELQKQWANSRMSRRQTQNKYGF